MKKFTLIVVIIGQFDDTLLLREKELITQIDFKTVLLDVMLSFKARQVSDFRHS